MMMEQSHSFGGRDWGKRGGGENCLVGWPCFRTTVSTHLYILRKKFAVAVKYMDTLQHYGVVYPCVHHLIKI